MYTVIPNQVCFDSNLNMGAKLLYGNIASFTMNNRVVFASNKYFAELYNVTPRTIQRWLEELLKNGYITIEQRDTSEESTSQTNRIINTTLKAHTNNEKREEQVMQKAVKDFAKRTAIVSDPGKYKNVSIDNLKSIWT